MAPYFTDDKNLAATRTSPTTNFPVRRTLPTTKSVVNPRATRLRIFVETVFCRQFSVHRRRQTVHYRRQAVHRRHLMEVMCCYKRENRNFFSLKLIKTVKTTQNEATPLFNDIFEMVVMSFLPHQKKGFDDNSARTKVEFVVCSVKSEFPQPSFYRRLRRESRVAPAVSRQVETD